MDQALYSLCYTAQSFVGIMAMLLLLLAIAAVIAYIFLKKSVLKHLAYISLAIFVILLVFYYALPYIEGFLYEGKFVRWSACDYPPPKIEPYCGMDYCKQRNYNETAGPNCTCLQY